MLHVLTHFLLLFVSYVLAFVHVLKKLWAPSTDHVDFLIAEIEEYCDNAGVPTNFQACGAVGIFRFTWSLFFDNFAHPNPRDSSTEHS